MPDDPSKNTLVPSIEDKDIYKIALDTRNFEISLYWQRSNYFLVLNSALAIGFFNLQKPEFALALAVFGFLASFIWVRVNLGSKFWQSRWESRLSEIERQIAPNLKFFSAGREDIQSDVERTLGDKNQKGFIRRWLDKQMLKRRSVSYNMLLLSLLFCFAWFLVASIRLLSDSGLLS